MCHWRYLRRDVTNASLGTFYTFELETFVVSFQLSNWRLHTFRLPVITPYFRMYRYYWLELRSPYFKLITLFSSASAMLGEMMMMTWTAEVYTVQFFLCSILCRFFWTSVSHMSRVENVVFKTHNIACTMGGWDKRSFQFSRGKILKLEQNMKTTSFSTFCGKWSNYHRNKGIINTSFLLILYHRCQIKGNVSATE